MTFRKSVLACSTILLMALVSATASAGPITITQGNAGGNGTTDNVLFNDGALLHSGLLVEGNFSGSNSVYVIAFTSDSGNQQIMGSGGQATITGLSGNDPFTSLTFGLEDDATFTNAILNIDANHNGSVQFVVDYLTDGGSLFQQLLNVGQNGSNFFHIDAGSGAVITSVTINAQGNVEFTDMNQFRIGGFAAAPETPSTVPEPASMLLLGLGLAGIAVRRQRARNGKA